MMPDAKTFQSCLLINTQGADPRTLSTELRQIVLSGMSQYPGFIRAEIHLCDDQQHVMKQTVWRSREAYQHYRQSSDGQHAALWLEPYQPQAFHMHPFIVIDNPA